MLIEITPDEVELVLSAINSIDEYNSNWDDLYDKIYKQFNHGELKQIRG